MKKVGIISLGCPKNRVDSEILLGSFKKIGYEITTNPEESDVIIINTCAFIKTAIKESIDTILEMANYNKKIIVTGCLAERYKKELKDKLPEINDLLPFSEYQNINNILNKYNKEISFDPFNRVISTYKGFAYLRIAEGCDNFCSFCAIPYIRGRYKSRTILDLVKETKSLVKQGVKVIEIIAQDTIVYGKDLKDGTNLVKLLKELEKIKELKYIRLMYLYPNKLLKELVDHIKTSKKVYPYFDIPLQHCSNHLLKSMNRHFDFEHTMEYLNYIRKELPNAILRTSLIVGYPGESKKDFNDLTKFVKDFKFDHVGIFSYSKEEGTKAYSLPNQVSEPTKKSRLESLNKTQLSISYNKNASHIGELLEGLCISYDEKTNNYYFLTKYNASGDIDGSVFSNTKKKLDIGKIYKLKIKDAFTYDLFVEII